MKKGIVDVGGGMKCAFSSGLYDYLLDNRIMITKAYGISAGASNLVTYISRQRGRTLRYYTIYPKRKEYMGLSHFIKEGSFLNLSYIYRTLSNRGCEDPFDFDTFFSSPIDVEYVATNALTGKAEYFPKSALKDNDMRILEASATLPVLNKPTVFEGTPYFDGGLSDPIPYKRAFEDGMDKVVVVLTRNRHLPRKRSKDALPSWILKRSYPESAKALSMRADVYNSEIDGMAEYEKEGKLLCVYPETTEGITTTKFKVENIMKLYEAGYEKGPLVASFLKG